MTKDAHGQGNEMRDEELEALLDSPESDRAERKESLSDKDKVCQAICAFANDLPNHNSPGVLFIGAKDDGSPSRLPITDKLLQELADLRSNGNILPFPSIQVNRRTLKGAAMAVVVVSPSDAPPVRFKGTVYIRVGPRRAIATREEEQRLSEKRRYKDVPFELLPAAGAQYSDLDEDLFLRTYLPSAVDPRVLEENDRSTEHKMRSLRFLTRDGVEALPTNVGVLAVGKEPRFSVPGAYIQFVRWDGAEFGDPIKDSSEIGGALPFLLRSIDEKLRAHLSVHTDIAGSDVEIRRQDYPLVALQQLIRNAVMHRTYESSNAPVRVSWFSDRIEIISPGGPFGSVNRENFGQRGVTDYRNPYLADVMKNLRYVQRFGVGIDMARRDLAANGNPPPEFQVTQDHILVTVRCAR